MVNRGRPARSGWSSTSVKPPCARTTAGSAVALLVGVLDAEPAAGAQQPGGDGQHAADDVEPVRAAPQRQRRVVVGDLARQHGRRRARRAGWRRRRRPCRRARDSSAGSVMSPATTPTAVSPAAARVGGVVPGPRDGAGVPLDGGHARAGVLVRDRQRDGTRSRCPGRRRSARPGRAARSSAQPASCSVSGRGHEDPGPDGELEVAEGGAGRSGAAAAPGRPAARRSSANRAASSSAARRRG